MRPILLDGPMGTELERLGVDLRTPGWSARALDEAPEKVSMIHRAYARAGAMVHTANTFRTRPLDVGPRWRTLTERAVELARSSVPPHHRVAGSLGPIGDCYRPEESPAESSSQHREMAEALSDCHVDLILCETFVHPSEALEATRAAAETGLETWLSLTAGPEGDRMTPDEMAATGRRALRIGATRVCVNCVSADRCDPFVSALSRAGLPFGVYANAGPERGGLGWARADDPDLAMRYARRAATWMSWGAEVLGGCCGTGPAHIAAMRGLVLDDD